MSAPTIQQIRQAIAAALELVGDDVQVSPYLVAAPVTPTMQVLPGPMQYDRAMHRGVDIRTFTVQAYVAELEGDTSQALLDEFMAPTGTRSVKAALELDTTLGGIVSAVHVTADTGVSMQLHPSGAWMLLAEWTLEIWTQN